MTEVPAITVFDRDAPAEVVAAELDLNGCAIVEHHVDHTRMKRLHSELQPYLDAAPYGRTEFAGRTSRRRNGLLTKSEVCRDLAIDPLVLGSVTVYLVQTV